MRTTLRVVCILVAIAFSGGLAPAGAAFAVDPPSLSVPDFAFNPNSGVVQQDVTYSNLPAHTDVNYLLPASLTFLQNIHEDNGTGCSGSPGFVGTCPNLSGSGVIHIVYRGDIFPEGYSAVLTFTVDSLGLSATGKVSYPAKVDLLLRVHTGGNYLTVVVVNLGPNTSNSERVTVTGFSGPVASSPAPCHGDTTMTCDVGQLVPNALLSGAQFCQPVPGPPSCAQFGFTFPPDWQATSVTVSLVGNYPDPNTSNNSAVVFVDVHPPGSGGGGGGSATNPVTPLVGSESPGPDASTDPSPTAAAASPTDPASPSDQAVAVPSRSSYAAVPWILGGAGGVLAFGGIGVAVALWVRRGRIALPAPGSAVPGQSGLTVSSEPSDGP